MAQIDVNSIPEERPSEPNTPNVRELPPLSRVGYGLSKIILAMISGFILFIVIVLLTCHLDASNKIEIPTQINISDSTFSRKLELIKTLQEEKKNYREFIFSLSQMVLLNLLLPTLTAILGYIFATKSENRN